MSQRPEVPGYTNPAARLHTECAAPAAVMDKSTRTRSTQRLRAPHDDQHASVRGRSHGCSESGSTMADATSPSNCWWAAALISCAPHVRRWVVIRRFGAGHERPGRRLRNLGDLAGQEAALEMHDGGGQPL